MLEPLRHIGNKDFGGVIFRRTSPQITNEGALWDEAGKLYPLIGAEARIGDLEYRFPAGSSVSFRHLQHEATKFDWQGAQVPFIGFDELTHFCVTPDTEVLTDAGWKNITDVQVGEHVPTLAADRTIRLEKVLDTPSFDYTGDLCVASQRNGVSFRVTPNHRMVVDRQDSDNSWKFLRADELAETHQNIPRTGRWKGSDFLSLRLPYPAGRGVGTNANVSGEISSNDYLALLGWYLSEGSAFLAAKSCGGTSPCVSIRQTKPNADLAALMARLPWRVRPDGDGGYRIFSRQLFDHLKPLGNRFEKRVPRWVSALSPTQQRVVLDAFIAGDGSPTSSGGWSIGLCNEGLIDDLQELAFYCGLVATKGYGVVRGKFHVHRLTISPRRQSSQLRPGDVRREPYSGRVHCLTVAGSGTFLMRHNGRFCWTGNSKSQFFYLLSRNRSTCGVRPYIRATCNPDADSWVAEFIAWWIDQQTGLPIPERAGVVRWFVRINDAIVWGDSPEQLRARHGAEVEPKSVSFIPAKLTDNPALMAADPGYLANLMALPAVERARLLGGNWKIRPAAGLYFKRHWCQIVDAAPAGLRIVRYWDLAATEKTETNDPDWTEGIKLGQDPVTKLYYLLGWERLRASPMQVETAIKNTASADGKSVAIGIPQDPAQAGKSQAEYLIRQLSGYEARARIERGEKPVRFGPFSAQCEAGNVKFLRATWNNDLFDNLEAFPEAVHDDTADACSGAFNMLQGGSVTVQSLRI